MRVRLMRSLLAVASAFMFVFLTGVVASSPAYAVGCRGDSCTGQSPTTMGCSADARTIDDITAGGSWRVEMRKSDACNAVWTRVTHIYGGWCFGYYGEIRGYTLNDHSFIGKQSVEACSNNTAGAQYFTDMWSFNDAVRSCIVDRSTGTPQFDCTGFH